MLALTDIDLANDGAAARYVKTETVSVRFATTPGLLESLEGPNHFQVGDAVITGSTGSAWSVTRARFDAKYAAVPPTPVGADGRYAARPVPVWAKQIGEPFTAARSPGGDVLRGEAGDWLLQYGPGDFGVCAAPRFASIYRLVV